MNRFLFIIFLMLTSNFIFSMERNTTSFSLEKGRTSTSSTSGNEHLSNSHAHLIRAPNEHPLITLIDSSRIQEFNLCAQIHIAMIYGHCEGDEPWLLEFEKKAQEMKTKQSELYNTVLNLRNYIKSQSMIKKIIKTENREEFINKDVITLELPHYLDPKLIPLLQLSAKEIMAEKFNEADQSQIQFKTQNKAYKKAHCVCVITTLTTLFFTLAAIAGPILTYKFGCPNY